ncbi:GNAT family N-acetyltransferase [Sphingobacterium multivorum]|uniref:Ribosomal N-acetyltransferase YdaF n=1 Tax=Sphingobacterium multivorum TaxID=28454 RepID=A0A2X2JD46_SPHMU|nr:GNAT family protein [Sphingobacterium multivorum]QRQ62144.1 GNAT family N-acetyltransferase [Sphingobacterium multivorum]SPZ92307.1 Putative ribosomal N-acetyltransferase YdaF [Sphingobacterium multivorum]
MRIDSERLAIRPIMPEDSRAIFGYRSDKETNKYQGWIPDSLAEVDEFIAKNPNTFNLPESWFQLVMTDKIAKAVIGDIGVHFFGAEHLQVELGCTIKKEFQQQGYAKEGLKTVIEALFRQHHKHRITASVAPENKASRQLLTSLGFRQEAHFVKSYFHNGQWEDDVVFAILAEEWKSA